MANPWTLAADPVMLTKPEYDWEHRHFLINEGPAFLFHDDKISSRTLRPAPACRMRWAC